MSRDPSKRSWLGPLAVAVVIAASVLGYWWFSSRRADGTPPVASEELAADFYTSLAALDVEETERAARVLGGAIEHAADEPALWANLAVTQLRLQDLGRAREALDQAMSLASDLPALKLIGAEVAAQAGEMERAIELFRQLHRESPENLSATYSLASLLAQVRSDEAEAERLELLDDLLDRSPENLRVLCEQARLVATLDRRSELREALDALARDSATWPEAAKSQLEQAETAVQNGDPLAAARALTFLENVLKPTPEYQRSLVELGISSAAALGTPMRSMVRYQLPPPQAAEADTSMGFELRDQPTPSTDVDVVSVLERPDQQLPLVLSLAGNELRVGDGSTLAFPGQSSEATTASIATADVNSDFRQDIILAGSEGCRLFVQQEDGSFEPVSIALDEMNRSWQSVWTSDLDADGDIDLLLSDHEAPLLWIRNNGDMTFTAMGDFLEAEGVVALRATDLDNDGDADLASLDRRGRLDVWRNDRNAEFVAFDTPFNDERVAITTGDVDRDGRFDLVSLTATGEVRSASLGHSASWNETTLVTWDASTTAASPTDRAFIAVADVDNNGGVDIVASQRSGAAIWLRTADHQWATLAELPAMEVTRLADLDADGRLDLVGRSEQGHAVAWNQSDAGYGWHVIEPLANPAAGDRRINSFGVGGRIEIRAGGLVQSALIDGPQVHFGLGNYPSAEVARIVWPNGTIQAEFDLQPRETLIGQQRLKGSCPWVFAFNGESFEFIKDFIWRSPLGLRINAQATAGVMQTEDWIKIPGESLVAADGRYQIRITAELWETHFFDHVSLLAVDHPANVDVFVDERFVPNESPAYRVHAVTPPQPLLKLRDHRGHDLEAILNVADGRYADGFELGTYQGVAEDHWVEFELPADVASDQPIVIVGHGWIYPTDSSLNVALAQGGSAAPYGLVLEQSTTDGQWQLVQDNLGFPAGKNKDVLIAIPPTALAQSHRFRLRTNMEIYWDSLGWAYEQREFVPRVHEQPVELATLRARGYSALLPVDRRRPDTPIYQVATTTPQWLDLEGYYTRFGDVRELLEQVDDRYVIMNAGDEMAFEFLATDVELPAGWKRDFVLVGDGWVKDGDFNTAFSHTVRPLPSHAAVDYHGPLTPLVDDPVYQKHATDWQIYHTRYVAPRRLQTVDHALAPSGASPSVSRPDLRTLSR